MFIHQYTVELMQTSGRFSINERSFYCKRTVIPL